MEGRQSAGSPLSPLASHYEKDDWVWHPDASEGYRRSRVLSVDNSRDSIIVAAEGQAGGSQAVRKSDVRPFYDVGEERTFQDNTEMVHLDDANILDNLRKRYCKDKIYTYTANVMLAVNPYKSMRHLYTREEMEKYWGKNPGTVPPHPYAIADVAYRRMQRDRKNQALVISGESGAGKTETAKITMHYLTSMSRTDAEHGNKIQEKIISANPILESFGNASTVMNMNSSRFGKYNEMMFDRVGSLVGAGMKTFLLESSRVVFQQRGEKNYHVFYELLAGMDDDQLDKLYLDREESYKLLHSSGTPPLQEGSPESQRLARQFEELKSALSLFVSEEGQDHIWDILAALIHLGQVDFVETGPPEDVESTAPDSSPCLSPSSHAASTAVSDPAPPDSSQTARVEVNPDTQEALETAADLLGLDDRGISKILQFREMRVNRQGRTSHIKCPRSLAQARQTLQCIIKVLYKRMFDKIVTKINEVSNPKVRPEASYTSIGTLDIYGFERLEHNSFEQLCINLANERLQQFFVEEVLQAEQRMYEEERLTVLEMDLPDSTPVVLGIQNVMKLLDEHSLRAIKNLVRTGPKDDKDAKYCEQVHRELIRDRQGGPVVPLKLKASRTGNGPGLHDGFQICHYAGPVAYSTRGWIDKNNDSLVPEIESLLTVGSKQFVVEMADTSRMPGFSGERLCSVSSTYLNNLNDLLATLKLCSVHYIRCFNPNQERKPGLFNRKYVLDQVIQCGTVELVRIMHYGYPHRCILKDLRARFEKLLPPEFAHYSDRNFMHAVMLAWDIDESQWTLGTTRLFLKAGQLRALEDLRDTGGQASQAVIRRIRKQFSLKKARAYAHAVEFSTYLYKVMKAGKRERNLANLFKAIRIMVQLNRWKNRALRPAMDEETESLFSRPLGIPFETMALEVSNRRVPQLFLTMAALDMPRRIAEKLGGASNEEYERLWQAEAKESLLYFHDGVLKSAKLSGGAFLGNSSEQALFDVRRVDCCDEGSAVPVSRSPEFKRIVCMCQHPENSRLFAHCEISGNEHTIMVWKWVGTSSDLRRPAVCAEVCFVPPRKWQIYQLCFLPHVGQPGDHVLAVLGRMRDCHWLAVSIYSVSRDGRMRLHSIKRVLLNLLDSTLRKEGACIWHFGVAHSGRTLVLAGNRLLKLYSIKEVGKTIEFCDLEGALDCESHILNRDSNASDATTVTAVCPLPMEPGTRGGLLDWIWVGLSNGEMFGILVEENSGGKFSVHSSSGRFRRNTHCQGVPIHAIVAVNQQSNHSVYYSLTMRQRDISPSAVLSIGADGKLLRTERCSQTHQWVPAGEWAMPVPGPGFAAAASGLLPSLLLLADEGSQSIMAVDERNPSQISEACTCSLA